MATNRKTERVPRLCEVELTNVELESIQTRPNGKGRFNVTIKATNAKTVLRRRWVTKEPPRVSDIERIDRTIEQLGG